MSKSDNVTWTEATTSIFTEVPPGTDIVEQETGTTANTDVTWTHAAFQTAVQQSLDTVADSNQISLVIRDNNKNNTNRRAGAFASDDTAISDDTKPRLIVEYNPPSEECEPGDEELRITRNDYDGPNPIEWADASSDHWFTITFTIMAVCTEVTDIKVQGGVASNLTIYDHVVDLGDVDYKSVGKGNKVLTWEIESLGAGDSANLNFDVSATFNHRGKAVCGIKNLTGDWSTTGYWDDSGTPSVLTDAVGKLIVDIGCPLVP